MEPVPDSGSRVLEDDVKTAIRDTRAALHGLLEALERLEASTLASRQATSDTGHPSAPMTAANGPASTWPSPSTAGERTPQQAPSSVESLPPVDAGWGSWASPATPTEPPAWPYPSATSNQEAGAAPASDDEAAREDVRRAVERLRSELEASPPSLLTFAGPESDDPEDLGINREASSGSAGGESPAAHLQVVPRPEEDERDSVDDSAARNEQLSPAMPGSETQGEPREDAEFDVREQVRRAVEEAKAEMQAESPPTGSGSIADAFDAEKLRVPHYEPLLDERFLQPAILVIDDPEGRVELVRVYRTLARLEVAATANLANYSSHSVTVQLEERKVPERQEITDAISYAFERDCSVDIDGNRASIRLFGGKTRVA